jgi:hypothetical protein
MNTVVSTHKIPAALAALTPLVLSSITMQLFGAIERLAACSKIKHVVLIVENPLHLFYENNCVLNPVNTRSIVTLMPKSIAFRFVILMRFSTPSSNLNQLYYQKHH